jgi:membrane-bound lytic murein transglycosylase A
MKTGTVANSTLRRQLAGALLALTFGAALLVSCTTRPPAPACPPAVPCPACPPCPGVTPPEPPAKPLQPGRWEDLPGWRDDDAAAALAPFLQSCKALGAKPEWRAVCAAAAALPQRAEPIRAFFEAHFQVYEVVNPDRSRNGLVTGYYEPLLKGSRRPSAAFPHAVFGVPDDLLVVDLGELYPELKSMRLRGRIEGRKVVPYYSRAELSAREAALPAKALYWVADPIELFFLQIQGSGRIELEDGARVRLGYADQNGHPYRSIGRWLADKGELSLDQTSMDGIRNWALANPQRLAELLNANPSYVFFKELPASEGGPPGALGVPLTPGRSIAVDPRSVPLGAPVFLATTQPSSARPINRLMFAQDTGGAIRGAVRADFFWGFGAAAGAEAGRMKSGGRMWVLLPPEAAPK